MFPGNLQCVRMLQCRVGLCLAQHQGKTCWGPSVPRLSHGPRCLCFPWAGWLRAGGDRRVPSSPLGPQVVQCPVLCGDPWCARRWQEVTGGGRTWWACITVGWRWATALAQAQIKAKLNQSPVAIRTQVLSPKSSRDGWCPYHHGWVTQRMPPYPTQTQTLPVAWGLPHFP